MQYLTGGNAGETPAGTVGGIAMYDYSFTLPTPFTVTGGTKYWVQVEASQNGVPDWGIAVGTGGDGKHFRGMAVVGDIHYDAPAGDAAFTLLGPSPAPPSATFSADVTAGRVPLTVTFTAIGNGTIDTWLWDFGDGSTATTGPAVTHTYSTWGTFDASLVISNTSGSYVVNRHNYITVDPWRVFLPVVWKNH